MTSYLLEVIYLVILQEQKTLSFSFQQPHEPLFERAELPEDDVAGNECECPLLLNDALLAQTSPSRCVHVGLGRRRVQLARGGRPYGVGVLPLEPLHLSVYALYTY